MKNLTKKPAPTFESVWALLQENAQQMQQSREDFERERKKSREDFERERKKSNEDFERRMQQSREDFDRRMKENDEKMQQSNEDFDRRMKKLNEQIGGLSNNHGLFAEEYFINAFKHGKKTFFGEQFDYCRKNVPGFAYEDEYDIVLLNGQSVGIVEVKYKVHDKDIANVIRKVHSFKLNYPEYRNHRFYLGLASLVFAGTVEDVCIDSGIAVIKQVGDTVVINDGHLRVF